MTVSIGVGGTLPECEKGHVIELALLDCEREPSGDTDRLINYSCFHTDVYRTNSSKPVSSAFVVRQSALSGRGGPGLRAEAVRHAGQGAGRVRNRGVVLSYYFQLVSLPPIHHIHC
jgi:hypothetical protein